MVFYLQSPDGCRWSLCHTSPVLLRTSWLRRPTTPPSHLCTGLVLQVARGRWWHCSGHSCACTVYPWRGTGEKKSEHAVSSGHRQLQASERQSTEGRCAQLTVSLVVPFKKQNLTAKHHQIIVLRECLLVKRMLRCFKNTSIWNDNNHKDPNAQNIQLRTQSIWLQDFVYLKIPTSLQLLGKTGITTTDKEGILCAREKVLY